MTVRHDFAALSLAILAPVAPLSATAAELDFEGPLPSGLAAMTFIQGAAVPASALVTDQYLSLGVRIENAALVAGGLGHTASGVNGLAGVDANGLIDYDQSVGFSFFVPGDATVAGTTDFFSYSPDLGGGSGNLITISAFDFGGSLLGQATYVETGTFVTPLSISGIGQFHRITVDQTLYNTSSGGIMLDLVRFGDVTAVAAVPEPSTYALMLAGLAAVAFTARRRKAKADELAA